MSSRIVNRETVTEPVSREKIAREVTDAVSAAAAVMGRALDRHAAAYGISDAKLQLLGALRCREASCACLYTLGDELCVSRPNVTKLVDGLERDGLVERAPHPSDRRMVLARLTPKGERVAAEALPGRARIAAELWSGLDDARLAQLRDLLADVA